MQASQSDPHHRSAGHSSNSAKAIIAGGRALRFGRNALAALLLSAGIAPSVWAQATDKYIGQLMLVPYTFCPAGWAEANGQLMSISSNTALFSLLGVNFGGNGTTTFALPDLRGRVPVGQGQGPGLSNVLIGQVGGTESVTLLQSQMPAHTHALSATNQPATNATPANTMVLATTQNAGGYAAGPANTSLHASSVGVAGGNQPVTIRDPYVGMRWCIALEGIFPSLP